MCRLAGLFVCLTFFFYSNPVSAQEYEYYVAQEELELNKDGFYLDAYGDCFVETLLLKTYADIEPAESKYPEVVGRTQVIEKGNLRLSVAGEGSGWMKKRVDDNCLSANPEDCLVKCWVKYPKRLTKVEIIDVQKPISLEALTEVELQFLRDANFIIYSQAPCETSDTELELLSANFGKSEELSLFEEIRVFQAENGLPIGELNMETIYFLELN